MTAATLHKIFRFLSTAGLSTLIDADADKANRSNGGAPRGASGTAVGDGSKTPAK